MSPSVQKEGCASDFYFFTFFFVREVRLVRISLVCFLLTRRKGRVSEFLQVFFRISGRQIGFKREKEKVFFKALRI